MGRLKLKIKRLESNSNRQVTYSKRRNGILKKAKELSILCDIDIALLMFSPTGRSTLFQGERRTLDDAKHEHKENSMKVFLELFLLSDLFGNFEEVITKFSQLTPQERAKRKLESLEALKKTFRKLDHDVIIQDFMGSSSQSIEDLTSQVCVLQAQLTELQRRLSCWSNPENINDIEHLRQMEDLLRESINRLHIYKENFGKNHIMPLSCTNQFQNEMPLPLIVGGCVQEAQSLPWIPNNENQQLISIEPNFLQHGDVQCSTDVSLPGCSSYVEQGECDFSELSRSVGLSVDFGEQYTYPNFGSDLSEDRKFKPLADVNLHVGPTDYQANSSCEMPLSLYDNSQHGWVSVFGP